MIQEINGITVYVVEFDTIPELPITGLTSAERVYKDLAYITSYPHGIAATMLVGNITYAKALEDAIETGVITEPGKYGIHLVPGTNDYAIYTIKQ